MTPRASTQSSTASRPGLVHSPGREGVLIAMDIELPTQPIPDDVAEACAWLSAAERYVGPGGRLRDRVAAGDVLDMLLDVEPPYPPIDASRPAEPLVDVAPHVIQALEREVAADRPPAHRLRVAMALGTFRQAFA